jgi:hypothetical protein
MTRIRLVLVSMLVVLALAFLFACTAAQIEHAQNQVAAAGPVVQASGEGVQGASAFLPPPWNLVLYGIGTLAVAVGSWMKGLKTGQQPAVAMATAIEAAKDASGVVNFANPQTITALNTMGAAAKAIVDNVQKDLL